MKNLTEKKQTGKKPAVERLLEEGFFENKEEALPYFMSGAVFCGGERVRTGGQRVPVGLPMTVQGLFTKYVGKGGYKLEGAIAAFQVSVEGRVCIDAGACTGGFTDCLLQHGARYVYAVEAGFGQLAGTLQQNPLVANLERTNLGEDRLLSLTPVPTLGSVDLSYLSLEKAVPQFRRIMHHRGELLCLVKPLFETEDKQARRTGKIDPIEYVPLLLRLIRSLSAQEGTAVVGVTHSPVTGNHGTHEFFLHISFDREGEQMDKDWEKEATSAAEHVLALSKYEK